MPNLFDLPEQIQQDPEMMADPSMLQDDPYTRMMKGMEEERKQRKAEEEYKKNLLEQQVKYSPKERSDKYFEELVKGHYGFTPDSTGKKVGAHILDSIMSIAGVPGFGGLQQSANKKGRADYEDMTKAYQQLNNQELGSQKLDAQSQTTQLAALMKQQQLEEQKRKNNQTFDLGKQGLGIKEKLADQGQQGMDIRGQLADSKIAMDAANSALINGKVEDQERTRGFIKDWNTKNPTLPWELFSKMTRQQIEVLMANGQIPEDTANKYLNIQEDLKNFGKSNSTGSTSTPGQISVDANGNITQGPSVRTKTEGPEYQRKSFQDAAKEAALGGLNPISQITAGKPSPISKRIADVVTNPKPIETGDPIQDITNLRDSAKKQTNPYAGLGGTSVKNVLDRQKEIESWHDTHIQLANLADNAGTQLSKGTLGSFIGPLQQNPLIKAWRTASGEGVSSPEASKEVQSIFAMAKHLKTQFQAGRPAFGLVTEINKHIDNALSTPEGYYKAQAAVAVGAELTKELKQNPQFKQAFDKLDQEFAKRGGKGSWANALNEELDASTKLAKEGHQYQRVTVDRVFDRALNNLKTGTNKVVPTNTKNKPKNDNDTVLEFLKD